MTKVQKRILLLSCGVLIITLSLLGLQSYQEYREVEKTGRMLQETELPAKTISFTEETRKEAGGNIKESVKETGQEMIEEITEKESAAEEIVTLLFGGDVFFKDYYLASYDEKGVTGIVSQAVLEAMTGADVMMVNQEFAFSERGEAEDKQYTFRTPPERVKIFKELGIDIVSLANNHSLDFGREALSDSFVTLDDAGILYVGAGENIARAKKMEVIEVHGKKIGFLAASRVIPVVEWNAGYNISGMLTTYSPELLINAIRENREACDTLVIYVHWGVEQNELPEEYQITMAKQYIDAGADIVVGSHPHVLQGVEYYKEKPILYSLGNYIFSSNTTRSALAELTIKEDGSIGTRMLPVNPALNPLDFVTGERKQEIYRYLEDISFGIFIDEDGNVVYNRK